MSLATPEQSSDEDDEPQPLLGFAVEPSSPTSLAPNHFPSKLGGPPAWLDPVFLPTEEQLCCAATRLPLRFLLQIYAASSDELHAFHRSLFLFVTPSGPHITRPGAVRAFRSQLPRRNAFYPFEPPAQEELPRPLIEAEVGLAHRRCPIWAADPAAATAEVAGDHGATAAQGEPVAADGVACVSGGSEAAAQQERPGALGRPQSYPEFELLVEPEPDESEGAGIGDPEVQRLLAEFKQRKDATDKSQGVPAEDNAAAADPGAEPDEAVAAADMLGAVQEDPRLAEFGAFNRRLALAPRQCIRYCDEEGGMPLWASRNGRAPHPVPPCPLCGSRRRFEFQVMPQALHYMQVDSASDDAPDWATIAVYTCAASCALRPEDAGPHLVAAPRCAEAAAAAVGLRVRLTGLQGRAELNGSLAFVLQWHHASERWAVECCATYERLRVRPSNLELADGSSLPPGGGYAEEYVWVQPQE